MTVPTARVALVTGCSSGIGHATAIRLHEAGLLVYASGRKPEQLSDLAAKGIRTVGLDVTDESSMTAAVEHILAEQGAIDVLVNNAGHRLVGPLEQGPPDEIRRLFETNVFGLVRLIQLVLPGMRERGYGRIVNLSSVYGRFAAPGGGFPAATKHAVNGLSDALRLEVAPFGIRVVLIEPSATRTKLAANAIYTGEQDDGPYGQFNKDLARWNAMAVGGPPYNVAGRFAPTADKVAQVITRAVTSRKPRARYPVGTLAPGLFMLRRLLPTAFFDAFIRNQFPVPKAPAPSGRPPARQAMTDA